MDRHIHGSLRIAAATAAFAGVHSLLASKWAKGVAIATFGRRRHDGLYRTFFNGQAIVTSAALGHYIRRQPGRDLYHSRGPLNLLMRVAQGAALIQAARAAHQVGFRQISGWRSLKLWLTDGDVPPAPVAQGPEPESRDAMKASGPFALSRHPLNFWPMAALWVNPRMTTKLLAFNIAATAYLVAGSMNEERRLEAAFGEAYRRYQQSGAPFYLPQLLPSKVRRRPAGPRRGPVTAPVL